MDKFLTYKGEQPIWLDDINFMNRAMSDTLTRIVHSLTQYPITNCILQGCEITLHPTELMWTDGIVMLDGEILPVRAGKIPRQHEQDYCYFEIVEEYDPSGKRMFRDGRTRDCYQTRYATIIYNGKAEYAIEEMQILQQELMFLYGSEKDRQIYRRNDGIVNTTVKIIVSNGGIFLSGTFSVVPFMGTESDTIMPATPINGDSLGDLYLVKGIRTAVMYYRNSSGSAGVICPLISSITDSDGGYKIALSFDKKYQFAMGEGNFYIRLN